MCFTGSWVCVWLVHGYVFDWFMGMCLTGSWVCVWLVHEYVFAWYIYIYISIITCICKWFYLNVYHELIEHGFVCRTGDIVYRQALYHLISFLLMRITIQVDIYQFGRICTHSFSIVVCYIFMDKSPASWFQYVK